MQKKEECSGDSQQSQDVIVTKFSDIQPRTPKAYIERGLLIIPTDCGYDWQKELSELNSHTKILRLILHLSSKRWLSREVLLDVLHCIVFQNPHLDKPLYYKEKTPAETKRSIPVVKGFLTEFKRPNPRNKLFIFYCPYCKDWHSHGWHVPASKSAIMCGSHRWDHCSNPDSLFKEKGYFIKPFTKKELKKIRDWINPAE